MDPILKRGLPPAEGTWAICDQDDGHIQEEKRGAEPYRAGGLFAGLLPSRQPDPLGSWR